VYSPPALAEEREREDRLKYGSKKNIENCSKIFKEEGREMERGKARKLTPKIRSVPPYRRNTMVHTLH
jgi:hypothetical protein